MEQSVTPGNIEPELERIWDSLQGTNKFHATLFNLIIFGKKYQRSGYLNNLAQRMIEKFPSRIIFVTVDDTHQGDLLSTSVSIMTADEGESELACDLINIEVAGDCVKRIPFLILPHILPDLPVYLVHASDPTKEDPLSYRIEPFATRVIYDSEASDSLSTFAKTVLTHKEKIGMQIADLNWGRTEGWRNLFADTFHTSDALHDLQNTKSITIHYNCIETEFYCHTKIQSIFLQAWLATRMHWNFEKVEAKERSTVFSYVSEHGPITVTLVPEKHEDLPPGRLACVEIESIEGNSYSFTRKEHCPHHIIIKKGTKQSCFLPSEHVFDRDESGASLVKEVCHSTMSEHFISVMNMIAGIKDEAIC